jgi:hypothetical protein
VSYTPVLNGMDYLDSAVQHLTAHPKPKPRDLKYAVLHLHAAVEVLLKARLVREHFSLAFKEPGSATRTRFNKGNFDSCNMTAAIDRLREIADVPISDEERKIIRSLTATRNALIHYGHTASAYAVEGSAADVLNFLLTFIPDHLEPALSPSEAQTVQAKLALLREQFSRIDALVKRRMRDLAGELGPVRDRTVACPVCGQWALVAAEIPVVCRFCRGTYPLPVAAADEYAWVTRRTHDFLTLEDCPDCLTRRTLVVARTAQTPDVDTCLCFACGFTFAPEELASPGALRRRREAMEAKVASGHSHRRHAATPDVPSHAPADCRPDCPHWPGRQS